MNSEIVFLKIGFCVVFALKRLCSFSVDFAQICALSDILGLVCWWKPIFWNWVTPFVHLGTNGTQFSSFSEGNVCINCGVDSFVFITLQSVWCFGGMNFY